MLINTQNEMADISISDNSKVKMFLILIFLAAISIITSIFLFVRPHSSQKIQSENLIPTTIVNKEIPTIVSEDDHTFLLQYPNISSPIQVQTKLVRIVYKNSNFSVEIFRLPTSELAFQYLNFAVISTIRQNSKITEESDISIDGFVGKKYTIENMGRIVLSKDEAIVLCWSDESNVFDVEFVCNWFVEERMI